MHSFEGTILSTRTQHNVAPFIPSVTDKQMLPPSDGGGGESHYSSIRQRKRTSSGTRVVRQKFVPDIGWASQVSILEIYLKFSHV